MRKLNITENLNLVTTHDEIWDIFSRQYFNKSWLSLITMPGKDFFII